MTAPVQPGDVLAEKYRVERVLGVGGMGVVVAAMHLHLEQLVALKFMLPEVSKNATAVARFVREARAVVRLKGEHVAKVLDVGTLASGAPYIVMEFLEGEDLGGTLGHAGKLSPADACTYLAQACEAMAEAHALGIVHRDLKPQNLFLTHRPDGTPTIKVLDFGISKSNLVDSQNAEVTHTAAMMGSPAYMSPEQIKSAKDVDARTDIWALGVILYQLVSGQVPFVANTLVELCILVMNHEPPPLDAPPGIVTIVQRCLRKDREERYANVADLVADLVPFLPRGGPDALDRVARLLKVTAKPSASLPAVTLPLETKHLTTLGSSAGSSVVQPEPTPRRWLPIAGAVCGIVALVVAIIAATRSPGDSDRRAADERTPAPPVTLDATAPQPPPVAQINDAALPAPASIDASEPPVALAKPITTTTKRVTATVESTKRSPVDAGVTVAQPPPPVIVDAGVPLAPPPAVDAGTKRDPFDSRH